MAPLDFMKKELKVGQKVVRAKRWSSIIALELKTVTEIKGLNVYLDDWHQPIQFNDRLVIVEEAR